MMTTKTSMKNDPIYSDERKEAAINMILQDYLRRKNAGEIDDKCDS